jgi:hypothetical protein
VFVIQGFNTLEISIVEKECDVPKVQAMLALSFERKFIRTLVHLENHAKIDGGEFLLDPSAFLDLRKPSVVASRELTNRPSSRVLVSSPDDRREDPSNNKWWASRVYIFGQAGKP